MRSADPMTPSGEALAEASASRARLVDVGLCILVGLPVLVQSLAHHRRGLALHVAAALLAMALVLVRRRWPLPTLLAALTAAVAVTALAARPTALLPACVVVLFTVAQRYDRRMAWQVGALGLAAFIACIAIVAVNGFFGPELLAGLAWPTLAVAAGDAVRSRREAIEAAEERAARAERSRDEEARRRVAEERLHIARELHDVVAHRIAVVNVQAGVAAHLLRNDPETAEQALAVVRSSARTVLDELAAMLGVLRAEGEDATPLEPMPDLDRLDALVASFVQAGLTVSYETAGAARPVGAATSLAVYRTVQEALTNAHKHGDGRARLRVAHQPDCIVVDVDNAIAAGAAPGEGTASGFGLIGMAERIGAVGGSVTAGPEAGGRFAVHARFPLAAVELP